MHYHLLEKNIVRKKDKTECVAFFTNELDEYFSCTINMRNLNILCFKDTQEDGFISIQCPNDLRSVIHNLKLNY